MLQMKTKISNLKQKVRDQRGVTLIEMLAVVVILAILAAVGVPIVLAQIQKARVNTDKSNEQLIADALQRAEYDYQSNSTNQGVLGITNGAIVNGSGANIGQVANNTLNNATPVYNYLLGNGSGNGYLTSVPSPQSQTGNFTIVAGTPSGSQTAPYVTFTYPNSTGGIQSWYITIQ
ncbi:prepilin-type N-terminal cleavage/methylation domain-containing protein [Alicyclobacillus vulcanalis]|uniref:Prepilin-type N-terminal cleavage/methylation domain-containing protein n=1 Tax=Alicyclobacillus vulcanalis TaxID=252246 RepID=A0A1N7PH55_9BACL|nr:type II secretion system protein [Alicyclobacillus vulcanalis]SIT09922.1 prepilin-type N-terminal cleavage/methylation domain-containing protein [Alicyclobacillus vulcanalis]